MGLSNVFPVRFKKHVILGTKLSLTKAIIPNLKKGYVSAKDNLKKSASLRIWVKVFKNGPSKICGRQPLKNLK